MQACLVACLITPIKEITFGRKLVFFPQFYSPSSAMSLKVNATYARTSIDILSNYSKAFMSRMPTFDRQLEE